MIGDMIHGHSEEKATNVMVAKKHREKKELGRNIYPSRLFPHFLTVTCFFRPDLAS